AVADLLPLRESNLALVVILLSGGRGDGEITGTGAAESLDVAANTGEAPLTNFVIGLDTALQRVRTGAAGEDPDPAADAEAADEAVAAIGRILNETLPALVRGLGQGGSPLTGVFQVVVHGAVAAVRSWLFPAPERGTDSAVESPSSPRQ